MVKIISNFVYIVYFITSQLSMYIGLFSGHNNMRSIHHYILDYILYYFCLRNIMVTMIFQTPGWRAANVLFNGVARKAQTQIINLAYSEYVCVLVTHNAIIMSSIDNDLCQNKNNNI